MGVMDELAVAAAVTAIDIDDDGEADGVLEDAPGGALTHSSPMSDLEATGTDKENDGGLPVAAKSEAEARKVLVRP